MIQYEREVEHTKYRQINTSAIFIIRILTVKITVEYRGATCLPRAEDWGIVILCSGVSSTWSRSFQCQSPCFSLAITWLGKNIYLSLIFCLLFSHSVISDYLQPHWLQYARFPILDHLQELAQKQISIESMITISSSVIPFALTFDLSIREFSSELAPRNRWPWNFSFSISLSNKC